MKRISFLLIFLVFLFFSVTNIYAQDYDCSDPYMNDDRLTECTDCEERCSGSISYNSCIYWCKGNNFCNNCDATTVPKDDERAKEIYVEVIKIIGEVEVKFSNEEEFMDAQVGQ